MTKTIKVALAGAGAFGIKHLDGLQNIDGVSVYEARKNLGRALAREHGIKADVGTTFDCKFTGPDGDYTLGGTVRVHSEGGTVRTADGALAGSTLSMLDAVRGAHALGVPLAAALRAATEAPARMARRADLGRLEPGARADLVVLDDSLELRQVLLDGAPVA